MPDITIHSSSLSETVLLFQRVCIVCMVQDNITVNVAEMTGWLEINGAVYIISVMLCL